jgi:LysM repeat protein
LFSYYFAACGPVVVMGLRRTVVNWLKAMLLMVVLGAILYGVNLVLNKSAPVESPMPNGAWSGMDGPIAPPSVNPGTAGTNAPPGNAPPSYGQAPPAPSAYGANNNSTTNPQTGYAPTSSYPSSAPPANASVYGANTTPTTAVATPNGNSSNTAPPPAAATSSYTSGGYGSAAPPAATPEQSHSTIPATTVGLTTSNANPNTAGAAAFASAMDLVTTTLREGRLAEGLQRLTLFYDDPQLKPEEAKQLDDLLGRLAGTVVYSRQHLLVPPYEIKPGDRLETIANEYQVPAALLAKINGIGDPDHLTAGNKLKVIRGPFNAFVNLNKREVTLVVQQCYAGRFKLVGMGKEAAALNGTYKVDRKSLDPRYHPPSEAARQGLPLIHHWVDFGDGFGFCGLADPNVADDPRGLTLSSRDAEDLFDILSVGSSIIVRP